MKNELKIIYNIHDLKEMLEDSGFEDTKDSFLYKFLTELKSNQHLISSIDNYIKEKLITELKMEELYKPNNYTFTLD